VMPPRGGNTNLSDIEVARAVVYMANKSGASFKEPASPAPAAATATIAATPAAAAAGATGAATAAPAAPASSAVAAPASAAAVVPANAGKTLDLAAAENLMKKDACAACHSVDKRIVGPAYRDVAAKYRNDKDALTKLTQKVKSGGGGVWGPIAMPPNAQVPDEDIKQLVSWILTLK
jgi:cytochrome c